MYIDESVLRDSVDLKLVVEVRASLHWIFSILGNTDRRVESCTFTNSVLVTLGGWSCHSGGAVAVVPILRAAPFIIMSKRYYDGERCYPGASGTVVLSRELPTVEWEPLAMLSHK